VTDPALLAAYDQDKATVTELLREAVWVYRQSLADEGGELPALSYMTTNYVRAIVNGTDGDLNLAVIQLSSYMSFAVQMLSDYIGEVK